MKQQMFTVYSDASLSPCGTYRYVLTRDWYPKRLGHVMWIMLNPSTADAATDDPTIRRCQRFAADWGYDGITVTNLFALRSTDPGQLSHHPDPVGPANDIAINCLLSAVGIKLVVAAWGTRGSMCDRDEQVRTMAQRAHRPLHVLGLTMDGNPRHPLYIPAAVTPTEWVQP